MFDSIIEKFRRRRAERLAERGYNIKHDQYRNSGGAVKISKKELLKGLEHMDAPEESEENNNNNPKPPSGGHGNTRLPFGLCKRYGIEIQDSWTPRDAWDALAGKGITAEGAYRRLKKGEDPGIPDNPPEGGTSTEGETPPVEPPEEKQPVKTFKTEKGEEIKDLQTSYVSWRTSPYTIEGKGEDGRSYYKRFPTRGDMMYFLKEKGIEEISDPETGEIVNPMETEFPEIVFKSRSWDDKHYSDPSIGIRKERYAVYAKDFDGKKRVLEDFGSLAMAKEFLQDRGVPLEKVKYSPAMKKGEKERLKWLESDKKEYIEKDGEKYGDLKCEKDYWDDYSLRGSTEEGKTFYREFRTKRDLMTFLKEQGVEKVKISGEEINPQEYEVPKSVASIQGIDYQKLYLEADDAGRVSVRGMDLDDHDRLIIRKARDESYEEFKTRMEKDYGVPPSKIDISDEAQERLDRIIEEDKEKARRKAEFEAKSVRYGTYRYSDLTIGKMYGSPTLYGYNERGEKVSLNSSSAESVGDLVEGLEKYGLSLDNVAVSDDMKEAVEEFKKYRQRFNEEAVQLGDKKYVDPHIVKIGPGVFGGKGQDEYGREVKILTRSDLLSVVDECRSRYGVEPEMLITSEEVKRDYEEKKAYIKEFDSKAVDFEGSKYMGIGLEYSYAYGFTITGSDIRGRYRKIDTGSYQEVKKKLEDAGLDISKLENSTDTAKKQVTFCAKEEELKGKPGYYEIDGHVYSDLRIMTDDNGFWYVYGHDALGEDKRCYTVDSRDEAMDIVEQSGSQDYKLYNKKGIEVPRPEDGMRRVRMLRTQEGSFKIMATVGASETKEVYQAVDEKEAREWLKSKGVDEENITTKGMNPNDDVVRTHTCLSLASFDNHRMEREDRYDTLKTMSDSKKKEVVDMLTDMFDQGSYVIRMRGHFEDVFDTHFKNLLETGTSGGSTDKTGRRETGEEVFGHSHKIKAEEAEKYGFLGLGNDEEQYNSGVARWYGKILYTFKKDALKDRVTYMFGDSLDTRWATSERRALAGYAGEHPTYEGVSPVAKVTLGKILSAYRRYKNGEISFSDFYDKTSSYCKNGYVECQFHDLLKMSDVESVIFPKNLLRDTFDSMTQEKRKKVFDEMQNMGVKMKYEDYGVFQDAYEFLRKEYSL